MAELPDHHRAHKNTVQPIVLSGRAAAVISVRVFYVFNREKAKMSLTSHSYTDELYASVYVSV